MSLTGESVDSGAQTGPLIVTALFAPGDDGWIQQLRRDHYPAERNQVPAHLTLFRLLPPSLDRELRRRLSLAAAGPAPAARIEGILDLGQGTALRVDSHELIAVREELAEAFHGLLMPQDHAHWSPHITIQNKVAPREARALQASLRARFEPRALEIAGLAAWRYLGGPWEKVRAFPFRG